MKIDEVIGTLVERLRLPLPGAEAHVLLAPRPRPGWKPGRWPDETRAGAGLILLFPAGDEPHVLLTLRSTHLPNHRGQVSLPGGAVEPDETIEEAALREANEEVGVDPSTVRVLGRLTALHIPASGYLLHPVVGATPSRPNLRPAPEEVARMLEVALAAVLDPANLRVDSRVLRGQRHDVPHFLLDGEKVWGATAMILAELVSLFGNPPDPWR